MAVFPKCPAKFKRYGAHDLAIAYTERTGGDHYRAVKKADSDSIVVFDRSQRPIAVINPNYGGDEFTVYPMRDGRLLTFGQSFGSLDSALHHITSPRSLAGSSTPIYMGRQVK